MNRTKNGIDKYVPKMESITKMKQQPTEEQQWNTNTEKKGKNM